MNNTKLKEYLVRRISDKETYGDLVNFPRYLEIETINACNARCPMCTITNWNKRTQLISDGLFNKIASEIIEHSGEMKRVSLYRDGEPLLDKKLAERIKMLKDGNVRDVAISTNASLLTEYKSRELLNAGIDLVIVSIDSLNKNIYEQIRVGLKFEDVLRIYLIS